MDYKVSFIGVGNMGGALLEGVCKAVDPKQVVITDFLADKARDMANKLGCAVCQTNEEAARAEYIFLCVKPQVLHQALAEISETLEAETKAGREKCLISIAAGQKIPTLRNELHGAARDIPIIRLMPNITASVGKGMIAMVSGRGVTERQKSETRGLLSACGSVDDLSESLMDQFTAISGCLPAYVCILIESLADAAVKTGLPRDKALRYAAQTVMGSAAMCLEQDRHPALIKDSVCSPGGSTIAGLYALERGGFRAAVMDAYIAAYERNVELGK